MGKDLKGKELGVGISQRTDGYYVGRFTTKYSSRKQKTFANYRSADSGWLMLNSKKEALTLQQQRIFMTDIEGNTYEFQYRFLLQTELRTGELVGLRWSDIDFEKRTMIISRSMEYRHSVGE